jgi:FkbM family methyltransferase
VPTTFIKQINDFLKASFATIVNKFAGMEDKFAGMEDKLATIENMLSRIETYSLISAKRFAVSCGQGRILIRSNVGYVVVDSKDYPLASILIEAQELEQGLRTLLEKLIEPGFVVVDVGANIGMHTITMSRCLQGSGVVHAFEPMPETAELLEANLNINGCGSNAKIHQVALSNNNGRQKLHLGRTSGHHSLYPLDDGWMGRRSCEIEVEVATLDLVLASEPYIDLIKIDAEGAELEVLEGASQIIKRSPDLAIIAEFGPSHLERIGVSIENWLAHFSNLGFTWFVVNDVTGELEEWTKDRLSNVVSANLLFVRHGSRFLKMAGL